MSIEKKKLSFIFFGTPDVASKTLDILKEKGYMPNLIITSPDKPSGRGLEIHETPVALWAKENNIECLKPEKITPLFIENLSSGSPRESTPVDLYVVVAYGKILPEVLIDTPILGTINIHYSLLPKYRGASPLESALLNGDKETGISIQQMAFKLDSGPILAEQKIFIDINETKEELKNKLIILGGNLLCEVLPKILEKNITPKLQNESEATYCTKIKKENGEININDDSIKNYNKYRAFYGWPGVYFFTHAKAGQAKKENKQIRVKIKDASYEDGLFIIKRVTPEGKKEVNFEDFLRSN